MIELLSHDTNIWMVFSFIIFFLILVKAGKSAMVNVVDKRIETIKNDLQSAENLHVEAQELLAQYQRKHTNAVKEADYCKCRNLCRENSQASKKRTA